MKSSRVLELLFSLFFITSLIKESYLYNIYSYIGILIILFYLLKFKNLSKINIVIIYILISISIFYVTIDFDSFFKYIKYISISIPFLFFKNLDHKLLKYFFYSGVFFFWIELLLFLFFKTTIKEYAPFLGLPRIASFWFDANFFSLSLGIYVLQQYKQENKINLFLTLPVFLSLSFTGIMLFILFFLLKNKTISLRYSIVIIFLFFLTYFNVISYLQKNRIETENPVIQYKLVSLYQRVDYQVSAITSIDFKSSLIGFGSGYTKLFVTNGRNLHNTFLQLFIESGFLLLFIITMFLFFFLKKINGQYRIILLFYITICSILIDVYSFPLIMLAFALSKFKNEKNHIFNDL